MSYNKIVIEKRLRKFLQEDCNFWDVSAICIPEDASVTAKIVAKSKGYVSGLHELQILYNILNVSTSYFIKDGDAFKEGDIIAELVGNARDILMGERTGLNLITHMSSITTTTRKYEDIIKNAGKNVKIACTRKTLPGLRIFEKRAVDLAGDLADTHRFSLDDMILLKDTHLKYYNGDVEKLLRDVKKKASFSKKIEIEIEKVDDVLIAAKNGADIIMLDNMTPDQVKRAIELLKKNNLRKEVLIEVSGGVNSENINGYLTLDAPDIISSSELTQFPSEQVDLSLRFD
jgi:nicotinate-nucleotide pyrophosphorylase (carboxylating)